MTPKTPYPLGVEYAPVPLFPTTDRVPLSSNVDVLLGLD